MLICLTSPIYKFHKLLFEYRYQTYARNIFNQRPIVINKISTNFDATVKTAIINTMHIVQQLHLCLFSFSAKVILAAFTSPIVSAHSSTNLSTNFFLHLQFS